MMKKVAFLLGLLTVLQSPITHAADSSSSDKAKPKVIYNDSDAATVLSE